MLYEQPVAEVTLHDLVGELPFPVEIGPAIGRLH